MSSRSGQIRENCFAHLARDGNCHRRYVQFQSLRATQPEGHALNAPLFLLCVSKKSVLSSAVITQLYGTWVRQSIGQAQVSCFFVQFDNLSQLGACVRPSASHSSLRRLRNPSCPPHSDIFFFFSLHSSAQAHSEASLSHTLLRLCELHLCFHVCISHHIHGFCIFHHTVLLHAQANFNDCNTSSGLVSHVQPMVLHILSVMISEQKGNFIFCRWILPPSLSSFNGLSMFILSFI